MTEDRVPAVSILIPTHNAERFIEETLVSIVSQTFGDFECIIVNDGSTDGTPEVIEKYLSDSRFKLINLSKVGLCAALNRGLELTRAPLIARMDSDDVMLPERLAVQVAYMQAHPEVGGCASFYEMIDAQGQKLGDGRSPLTSVEAIERHLQNGGQLIYPNPTLMLRRSAMVALGGYRAEYFPCEDVDLSVRMLEAKQPIIVLPQYLLKFRMHPTSVSSSNANALRQFHTNKLIFRNLRARRRGEAELPIERYFAELDSAFALRKLATRMAEESFVLHRKAARAKTAKHHALGSGLLLLAFALNPRDAYLKVMRRARAAWA